MKAKDLDGFLTDTEKARKERKDRLLLNGPASDGKGIAQNEVDNMFN
jgi:hypothetical protein